MFGAMNNPNAIELSLRLQVPTKEAWALWTQNAELERWLTAKANVNSEQGGSFELFWEPERPEQNSTLGCRITEVDEPKHISFEWRGPVQFHHLMNVTPFPTHVDVYFDEADDSTVIRLRHDGWGDTPEWKEARAWQEGAWRGAFDALERYVGGGSAVMVTHARP